MMQNLLMFTLILMSLIFSFMTHPLSMGLILMIQTMLIVILSGLLTKTFWFSYSLFLIFLGGMLILFMYMTSIASNEEFKFKINLKYLSLMISYFMLIILFILLLNEKLLFFNKIMNLDSSSILFLKTMILDNNFMLNKMYNFPMNMITILLVNYLFLTLIAVVKITNIFEGPMRKKTNF
uniref:NADH dehydrogenase subunit 6 n=1 Tax=Stictochironomus rosenschoeldi TaxID=2578633 RepID=UPI0023F0F507|nr:NADH dehydrogenase subunit 6 [Stictochironomus rosenschoeldi]WEF49727.1 NADH dehydrogenase subunit 6 [Stictochironomus rosenschoeldi]